MPAPLVQQGSVFRAETRMEPDRVARLAISVAAAERGRYGAAAIQFTGAAPTRLSFSVRSMTGRVELIAFTVEITSGHEGFTVVRTRIDGGCAPEPSAPLSHTPGYPMFKRYTLAFSAALARFDPDSAAVLTEEAPR
jgi:hypothetical protein